MNRRTFLGNVSKFAAGSAAVYALVPGLARSVGAAQGVGEECRVVEDPLGAERHLWATVIRPRIG
jgi:hypothetical protein